MLELKSYFDGMTKPMLKEIHARAYGKKGLLNNALIQAEVLSFFSNMERASALFEKMEPWQKRCLDLIYHSGSRGLTYNELRLTVNVSKNKELQAFLLSMCKEFLLWRTSGNAVYHGFRNFATSFLIPAEDLVDLSKPAQSYGNLIDWHICEILALAKKEGLKINANGTLHRRSRQDCQNLLVSAGRISEKAAESELILIFNFLVQNKWLEEENSSLYPSEKALEFLRKNGFRLHQDVISWWLNARFHKDTVHCTRMLRRLANGMSISEAVYLFWVMDPTYRILEKNKALSWDYLPRPMRELWLLGLVDFQIQKEKGLSKIAAVILSESGKEWVFTTIMPLPEPSISALPNFDLITSTGTSPRVLFTLACLADVKNDETFLCFNFNKESYLKGLKSGIAESELEHFRTWIKPPVNVANTFEEWNSAFFGAKVQTVRLLKLENKSTLTELSKFTAFMECVEESITGYGFILKPEKEGRALEILENYGYTPFVDSASKKRAPANASEWMKDFVICWPEAANPDYELKDESKAEDLQASLNATKYGSLYRKLDTYDLVKVLRYAKMAGSQLSAKIKNPEKRNDKVQEITFSVHSLHLAKSPFNVEILETGKSEIFPLLLNYIQEIKVLHSKN